MNGEQVQPGEATSRATLGGHIAIARFDHWTKNVFAAPGVLMAAKGATDLNSDTAWRVAIGFVSLGLIASSNYVLNELLDAPFDINHPTKRNRPVPAGRVNIPLAYVQWLLTMAGGIGLGMVVGTPFAITMAALWIMGIAYNVPPLRTKDKPFVDVLSESVNNPIRLLAGWFMVIPIASKTNFAPASLLLSYWMIGCYFMALKRFAEYRTIGDDDRAAQYRKSFAFYNEHRLLIAVMFYGSSAMLFFGAFVMRYRLELIASFPVVAWLMAVYLHLSFKPDSAVQAPENLYRERSLVCAAIACALIMGILMFVDMPFLHDIFQPTAPVAK